MSYLPTSPKSRLSLPTRIAVAAGTFGPLMLPGTLPRVFPLLFPLVRRCSQQWPGRLVLPVPTAWVVDVVRDGDDVGWANEIVDLWDRDPAVFHAWMLSARTLFGLSQPIDIAVVPGARPRMWDGHHRVAAAVMTKHEFLIARFHLENP